LAVVCFDLPGTWASRYPFPTMAKKSFPEKEDTARTEEARKVVEEYANDQREIIKKLRKPPLDG
jgi:hypothetical protein